MTLEVEKLSDLSQVLEDYVREKVQMLLARIS